MEFLKEILGDGYAAVEASVKAWNNKPENKDNQIKIVNAGSGEYVSKSKYDALDMEKKGIETQLTTATDNLKKFEGIDDPEKLQDEIQRLTGELDTQKTTYEAQIADMEFNSIIDAAISEAGGRSVKAVKAMLDINTLKGSKDQTADIKSAIEKCQKENAYLFGMNEPINHPVGPTNGPVVGITKEQFQKMGYKERLELKQSSPQKYKELKGE